MDAFRLDGEVALITGGGTGLGLAIAKCMTAAGAKVVITGRREQVLQAAVAEVEGEADYEVFDVRDTTNMSSSVERIVERCGAPTILVNNAGVHVKKPALEHSQEDFTKVLETHVTGAFALTQALAPYMIERQRGSVIFIASMASFMGIPLVAAYSAAKSAHLGIVRTLASELSPQGVRVNAIAPGFIESPMLRKAFESDPAREQRVITRTPAGALGEADDIGWAAVYLASPAAKYVTGTTLVVDGGTSIGF